LKLYLGSISDTCEQTSAVAPWPCATFALHQLYASAVVRCWAQWFGQHSSLNASSHADEHGQAAFCWSFIGGVSAQPATQSSFSGPLPLATESAHIWYASALAFPKAH
jgi:hypothetical protein